MGDDRLGVGATDDATGEIRYKQRMTDFHDLPKNMGEPPDEFARFGSLLIEWCHDEALKQDALWKAEHEDDTRRFYYHNAGKCARALGYAALKVPASNPADPQGEYIMWLGSFIHDAMQKAVKEHFGEVAEVEVKVSPDPEMGGRIDIVVKLETGNTRPFVVSIEIKTLGGYGYKMASATFNGPPEGPRYEHKVQGALGAKDVDADELVIVYLAREPNQYAANPMLKVVAEWTYKREVYEPWADAEIARAHGILSLIDNERMLPARKIPELRAKWGDHLIIDPSRGDWSLVGDHGILSVPDKYKPYAMCNYCSWQDVCAQTGADREPIDVLVKIGALGEEALSDGGSEAREQ